MTDTTTVDQIAAERGISRRWAYKVLRDQREEEFAGPVPTKQRDQVLLTLFRKADLIRTSTELTDELHHQGIGLDGHDTIKTLWGLQKTNHVKFRERQNPRYLYAIKLTDLGTVAAKDLMLLRSEQEFQASEHGDGFHALMAQPDGSFTDPIEDGRVAHAPFTEEVYRTEPNADGEVLVTTKETSIYAFITDGHPAIAEVAERGRKAQRLAAAAVILEEVGEDEMALTLMGKTEFTDLELEVLDILKHTQEI